MWNWFSRNRSHPPPAHAAEPPSWARELQAELRAEVGRGVQSLLEASRQLPAFVGELLEAMQKLARSQAKLGVRLEALEGRLDAGFGEIRSRAAATPAPARQDHDELLDALDVLDAAIAAVAALPEGQPTADGLRGVRERTERFLGRAGLRRLTGLGAPPDGRTVRVVGDLVLPGLPDGAVARIIRAAVLQHDRLVREGEVLVNRSEQT
jgi:molecular chaperone GrpE (heat shock protein)